MKVMKLACSVITWGHSSFLGLPMEQPTFLLLLQDRNINSFTSDS